MAFVHFGTMALATLVGLSLGVLGSGGSIIVIPVLVYVAQIPAKTAVGMSLVIVGTTSLLGALLRLRQGSVALKPALLMSLTGMVGSFLGASGTHLFSQKLLMLIFSGVMFIVGSAMWRGAPILPSKSGNVYRCLPVGFAVGLLTGFLGIGGGFLIVPALVLFAGLEPRVAMGTSLAVIALNSGPGLFSQLRFVQIDWTLLWGFLLFALGGMIAGSRLSNRIPEHRLRRIFAATVLVLAVAVGFGNLFWPGFE